jgi:hypothetical protein
MVFGGFSEDWRAADAIRSLAIWFDELMVPAWHPLKKSHFLDHSLIPLALRENLYIKNGPAEHDFSMSILCPIDISAGSRTDRLRRDGSTGSRAARRGGSR